MRRAVETVLVVLFAMAVANLLRLAATPGELRLFKPLLYVNGTFLLALAARRRDELPPLSRPRWFWMVFLACAILYSLSFTINLDFPDWTHRAGAAGRSPIAFFTERQYDGFYRPLGFLSLWMDNAIFGSALAGYHAQSIALHLLNGWLVLRLVRRLGYAEAIARWSAVLFLAVPASFEAVIWPGARFDLLAAAFTFAALERALAGAPALATLLYACGVLSKESAYCYPLILALLWLWHRPVRPALLAAVAATAVLVAVRIAVYGNLGGYPDHQTGGAVNFVVNLKSFTSIATRLPGALYLLNSSTPLTLWMRGALLTFVAVLAAMLYAGAGLGRNARLLAMAVLAVVPMWNMFGWINESAQQGRYLYQAAAWIAVALACSVPRARYAGVLALCFAAGALFNTGAYRRMLQDEHAARDTAVAACRAAGCCRSVSLGNVPERWQGAFYFRHQLEHDVAAALPGIPVASGAPAAACTVALEWRAGRLAASHDPPR